MNAIISNGDYTASVQLPVERKQLAGALSYLGKNHASAYDIQYNEESDKGLSFTLDCRGIVENAIAKAIPTGFRFHTFNDTIALMHNLPYQSRREFENTVKVEGLASYEQLNRMEADLILLEKDPAKDISNIRFINKVFAKGKTVYSSNPIASYDIPEYSYPEGVTEIDLVSEDGSERKVDVSRYASDSEITVTVFKDGKVFSEEKCKVGKNLSAEKWGYVRASDNTEITAEKVDGYIHLTGTFKGKAQDKTFRIEDGLWYQTMDMAMPAFIASAQEEILFYSIGTGDNRGAMGLGEFAAKKCGEETVELNGKNYNCHKISFVLTQFSWAWTGYYWFDKKTGQMIQSGEKKGNAVTIKVRAKL